MNWSDNFSARFWWSAWIDDILHKVSPAGVAAHIEKHAQEVVTNLSCWLASLYNLIVLFNRSVKRDHLTRKQCDTIISKERMRDLREKLRGYRVSFVTALDRLARYAIKHRTR